MSGEPDYSAYDAHIAAMEAEGICGASGLPFAECQDTICDCFRWIDPDDPFSLHPEAFITGKPKDVP